jgi:hypothetical protein
VRLGEIEHSSVHSRPSSRRRECPSARGTMPGAALDALVLRVARACETAHPFAMPSN